MAQRIYNLTPLTGIHIGTGEELTFLDYKIASKIGDIDFNKKMFIKFSSDRILQRLAGNEQIMTTFERASVNGNMKELIQFFHENCTNKKDSDYLYDITKKFLKTYEANRNKDPHQNAAKVLQMYHCEGTSSPVIPGSSLKGSIRTALLNCYLSYLPETDYDYGLTELNKEGQPEKFDGRLQGKLLEYNDAKNDPLRAVLIPDCSFKDTNTQLVGGLDIVSFNKQNESLEPIGTQIQAEVLKGEFLGGKAISELCISINEDLQKTKHIKKIITFDDIHESCNYFFWREFQNEYNKFYKDINDGTEEIILELKKRLENAIKTKDQFIVRVGRWSQVEYVTFEENFRKPQTKKGKYGKPLGYGGTRTLFDYDGKHVPMGWCILSVKE